MAKKGPKSPAEDWITKDGLLQIEGWARDGLIDKQIAGNIGINEATFCRWKQRYPSIVQALKKGKAPVDIAVENAMLKSALGFSVKVKKPIKLKRVRYQDKKRIEEEYIEMVDEEQYISPNVTAQIFWLKNRKPEQWREKQEKVLVTEVEDLTSLANMLK